MKRTPILHEKVRWTERAPLRYADDHPPLRVYERRAADGTDLRVIVGREPIGRDGAMEWHLSISAVMRYPTWDEIAEARERYLPDLLTFGMILPPRDEYVNLHETTFHLHEMGP